MVVKSQRYAIHNLIRAYELLTANLIKELIKHDPAAVGRMHDVVIQLKTDTKRMKLP